MSTDYVNECRTEEFKCSDGTCLSVDSVCNGHADCTSGDDETNCGEQIVTIFVFFFCWILFKITLKVRLH